MNPFLAVLTASLLARLSYQMARSPVLPRFAEELGAAPELIGMVVAASTITGVVFKLPAGALSDLLGRRRVMLLGAVFFAVPPFFYPLATDAVSLLALRFVHGFATAIFAPVASAYVAGLGDVGRGARLGWFSSAGDIGATAGPLLGGLVLYATASFTASYLLVGVLGVLAFGFALAVPQTEAEKTSTPRSVAGQAAEFRDGLRDVVTTPVVLTAAAVEATMYLGFGAFLGFLPLYAASVGLDDAEIAVILAIQLTTALLVKPLAGRISDRVGRKPVIVLGLLAAAASLPLIFRAASFASLAAIVPLLGLGVAAVTPATNALIADLVAARRLGTGMGVFGTIWDIGEAAGPILAGVLIGQIGYGLAFDAIAAIMAAVALVFAVRVRLAAAPAQPP
ncbi:MAG TPA: MFS transporter [Stellaceae bacterium]|nr:MFS transporter [Stellaceae bacterium]